jgi:hypothetical protein
MDQIRHSTQMTSKKANHCRDVRQMNQPCFHNVPTAKNQLGANLEPEANHYVV